MERSIALLRGVNVGGARKIRMAELREHLSRSGLEDAQTYIQSGNLLVRSDAVGDELRIRIESAIARAFGFPVDVVVISPGRLAALLHADPFADRDVPDDPTRRYFTFLVDEPDPAAAEELTGGTYEPDEVAMADGLVYLLIGNRYGASKLSNAFIEETLRVRATTRNLRTLRALLELADQASTVTTIDRDPP
ncbi:MAG: DUF1697 domain-containing protein [Spirochaetota bacterium]